MSAQRARWAVPADHRSIHPGVAGVPWWAAVVVAATMTLIGFGFDATAGTKELTGVFATFYVLGCVGAVLAVRQSGLFTAVIQPPLILFCAVPGAYFVFHGSSYGGLRNLLINCGYPLIERFPLMLFTSALVLLIGAARWIWGLASRGAGPDETADTEPPTEGFLAGLATKLRSVWGGGSDPSAARSRVRRHTVDRSAADDRPARRPRKRPETTGERPARRRRPSPDDAPAPRRRSRVRDDVRTPAERRRRSRPRREFDESEDTPSPRRRRPAPTDASRDLGRPGYERRSGRYDSRYEDRYEGRYDSAQASEWAPPRRPRVPAAPERNGTHHPISRVRYRGSAGAESRNADSWEYDI